MGVTIKDIAREAGVSHATVSKALNNVPGISEKTRKRILSVAGSMNYVPNMAARKLVSKLKRGFGLIWPRQEGLFFYHLCSSLQKEAGERSLDILISMAEMRAALQTMREHLVDFVVLWAPPDFRFDPDIFRELQDGKATYVILGGASVPGACEVHIDRFGALVSAVRLLHESRHRSVGFIGQRGDKYSGYMQAMLELGMAYRSENVLLTDYRYLSQDERLRVEFEEQVGRMLMGPGRPTAVIADAQDVALPMLQVIARMGLRIPEDISVVVYDDVPELAFMPVPITTCGPVTEELVSRVFELFDRGELRDCTENPAVVSSRIRQRASVKLLEE